MFFWWLNNNEKSSLKKGWAFFHGDESHGIESAKNRQKRSANCRRRCNSLLAWMTSETLASSSVPLTFAASFSYSTTSFCTNFFLSLVPPPGSGKTSESLSSCFTVASTTVCQYWCRINRKGKLNTGGVGKMYGILWLMHTWWPLGDPMPPFLRLPNCWRLQIVELDLTKASPFKDWNGTPRCWSLEMLRTNSSPNRERSHWSFDWQQHGVQNFDPPQEIAGLMIRAYEKPLVSLNKALLNPYFWGGGVRYGGLVGQP